MVRMSVVTPGDILARCQVLDGRIAAATKVIDAAPSEQVNASFRDAWLARARRWQEVRTQCSDYASRWWNYKWGPVLDDWSNSQAAWEAKIQTLTGVAVPIGQPLGRPDDETLASSIDQAARFPNVRRTMNASMLIVAGGVAAGVVVWAWRR